MYLDRDDAGRIVNAWQDPQREGHELVPIDSAELQAWLAQPVASFDEADFDGARWA